MNFAAKYSWLLLLILALALPSALTAQDEEPGSNGQDEEQEKLIRRNWSLFSESFKMNDFTTAKKYGWLIYGMTPTRFKTLHPRMVNLYDSLWARAEDPAMKSTLADTAMFWLNDALKLFPENRDANLLQRGYMFERLYSDRKADAVADYEAGIHGDYAEADLWYLNRLAVLYAENAEAKNKAIEVLQAILLRDPNSDFAQQLMKSLVSNPEEYVQLLSDAYYADPTNRQKLYELANAFYEQLQNYDSAAVYFEKLVMVDPTVMNYWERLAASYMYLGSYSKAIDAYVQVTTLDPDNREGWINLARAQKEVGRLSDARNSAEKALDASPNWGAAFMLIGQVYEAAAAKCVEGTRGGWANMKIMDKAMYTLAQSEYRKAANDPQFADQARSRIGQIQSLTPTAEDLFRNGVKKGSTYPLNSGCYGWINRSVVLTY